MLLAITAYDSYSMSHTVWTGREIYKPNFEVNVQGLKLFADNYSMLKYRSVGRMVLLKLGLYVFPFNSHSNSA